MCIRDSAKGVTSSGSGEHEGWVYRPAPLLGENTQSTLENWLGYREADVQALRDQGIV